MNRALVVAAVALLWWQGGAAQGERESDSAPVVPPPRARFWIRPAASLLLPGSGQLLGHQDRSALYLAVELYSLARILQLTHEGRTERDRFHELAFAVARRSFTPTRRDTVFEYYETMERFTASGQFDRDPGPALVPESDPSTYNGSVWLLARRTFWPDPNVPPDLASPEYVRALQFYQAHAVGPDFLWSWGDASLQQAAFRETIRKSDNAFRTAQDHLGILLANHVASAIDALISSRLSAAARRSTTIRTTIGHPTVVRLSLAF